MLRMPETHSTTPTARLLDAAKARGCRRREKASTQARQEETKDKHGRLIGTMHDLPLLRQCRPLRRKMPPKCLTQRERAQGRPTIRVRRESEHPCSRALVDQPVCATHPLAPIDQTLPPMPARTLTLAEDSSGTHMVESQTIRFLTCMQTRATKNPSRMFSREPINLNIHRHHQKPHSMLRRLLRSGSKTHSQRLPSRRATAPTATYPTASRVGARKALV